MRNPFTNFFRQVQLVLVDLNQPKSTLGSKVITEYVTDDLPPGAELVDGCDCEGFPCDEIKDC